MRTEIVIQHGEHRSLFYLVDAAAPEGEQPAVLDIFGSLEEAEAARKEAKMFEGNE